MSILSLCLGFENAMGRLRYALAVHFRVFPLMHILSLPIYITVLLQQIVFVSFGTFTLQLYLCHSFVYHVASCTIHIPWVV